LDETQCAAPSSQWAFGDKRIFINIIVNPFAKVFKAGALAAQPESLSVPTRERFASRNPFAAREFASQ